MAASRKLTDPISLRKAAWQFAPSNMRSEAKNDRSKARSRLPRGKFGSPQGEALISVLETIGDMAAAAVDPHEPTPAMKALLLRYLQRGKYRAFGVRTKPELGQAPQAIPVHLFKGKPRIDWRSDTLDNLGQRFEIIEVAREPLTRTEPASKSKVKRGRQRVDIEISTVIGRLRNEKSFDGLLEKQKVALIQRHCREQYPTRFPTPTQPSLTKIREVLKRDGL
jgi:hypothetical protein